MIILAGSGLNTALEAVGNILHLERWINNTEAGGFQDYEDYEDLQDYVVRAFVMRKKAASFWVSHLLRHDQPY